MAVKVRNLSFAYDGVPILEDINLDLMKGSFTVVLGKNGSGKSTLFRLLAGFLTPKQGHISLGGRRFASLNTRQRARILGFLPQHHRPVFPFVVEEVVLTGRASHIRFLPGRQDRRCAWQAIERIGIEHLKGRLFTELSGGEQQLVMIARVLAQNPEIILLDEPTSHLDFFFQAKVLSVIRDLVKMNFTVGAILHDPNIAALYGDRFVCLKNGRILSSAHEFVPNRQTMEEIFGLKLETISFSQKNFFLPKIGHGE